MRAINLLKRILHPAFEHQSRIENGIRLLQLLDVVSRRFKQVWVDARTDQARYVTMFASNFLDHIGHHSRGGNDAEPLRRRTCSGSCAMATDKSRQEEACQTDLRNTDDHVSQLFD